MTARLIITDGVERIDLLADGPGFHVYDWRSLAADYKNDGVWQESSLADGRRLVDRQYANVVETFKMHGNHVDQNSMHALTSRLRRLLEQSARYWISRRGRYVWIEARSSQETNSRFAILQRGRLVDEPNLFQSPFLSIGGALSAELTLLLERGHWLAALPGQEEQATISAQYLGLTRDWNVSLTGTGEPITCLYPYGAHMVLAGTDIGNLYLGTWSGLNVITWVAVTTPPADTVACEIQALVRHNFTSTVVAEGGVIIPAGLHMVATTSEGVFVGTVNDQVWVRATSAVKATTLHSLIEASDHLLYALVTVTGPPSYIGVYRSANAYNWTLVRVLPASYPTQLACVYEWTMDDSPFVILLAAGGGYLEACTNRVDWFRVRYVAGEDITCFFTDPADPSLCIGGGTNNGGADGVLLSLRPEFHGSFCWVKVDVLSTLTGRPVVDLIEGPDGDNFLVSGAVEGLTHLAGYYSPQDYAWGGGFDAAAALYHDDRFLGAGNDGADGHVYDALPYEDLGTLLGQEPAAGAEVTIVNHATRNTLTQVFRYFNSVFTNLLPATLPVNLLGIGGYPQINDAIYFGAAHFVATTEGPFTNLVFDLSDPLSPTTTLTWEYLATGATWKTLTVADETQSFHLPGVRRVSWEVPADWDNAGDLNIGGGMIYTGYWVRARLTVGPSPVAIPIQANRQIYTANADYAQLSDHSGDLAALGRVTIFAAGDDPVAPGSLGWFNRVLIAQRSLVRGAGFSALLPLTTFWPQAGVSVAAGGVGAFSVDPKAPNGYDAVKITPTIASQWQDACIITLSPTVMAEYYGVFRAGLRYRLLCGSGLALRLKLRAGAGQSEVITSEYAVTGDRTVFSLADFGRVVLPGSTSIIQEEISDQFTITVQVFIAPSIESPVGVPTIIGTPQLMAYDLMLMPSDEWAGNVYDRLGSLDSAVVAGRRVEIDSATSPLSYVRGVVKNAANQVTATWMPVTPGELAFARDPDELGSRLWFLLGRSRQDGNWTKISTPVAIALHHLEFLADRKGRAAGGGGGAGQKLIYEYDPATGNWTVVHTGTYDQYWVAPAGVADVWTAGNNGVLMHYNGTTWTAASTPSVANMRCIAMPPTVPAGTPATIPPAVLPGADGWAMGIGGVIWRYVSPTWSLWRTTTANDLVSIFMRSTKVGVACGASGVILRRNDSWEVMTNVDISNLKRIVYAALDDTWWAVGETGHILHYQYDAISVSWSWQMVAAPTDLVLNDICYVLDGAHYHLWAVGGIEPEGTVDGKGCILMYTSTNNTWSLVTHPLPTSPMYGVSAARLNNGNLLVFADGRYATLKSTNGTTFTVETMYGVKYEYGIDVCKRTADGNQYDVMAVGPGCIYHNNNGTWDVSGDTTNYSPLEQIIRDVVIMGDADAFAVADGGAIARWNGSSWVPLVSPTNFNLHSIAFDSTGVGWACGDGGTLVKVVGNTCTALKIEDLTTMANLYGIANLGIGRWRAVGDGGVILDYDDGWRVISDTSVVVDFGNGWVVQPMPNLVATTDMRGCFMPANDEAWVVGEGGMILRWLAGIWEKYPSPTSEDLTWVGKIWEDIFIGGENGTFLRWDPMALVWEALDGPGAGVSIQALSATSRSEIWATAQVAGEVDCFYRYSPMQWDWPPHITAAVKVDVNARYLGSRGAN